MKLEIWRAGGSATSTSAAEARRFEAEGWDGQMFMDSQSLGCDPYVMMGAWAAATARLKLSTGVTNPLTRHPAVTAASALSVHTVSGGRAVLGIGRGDSALAHLGCAPDKLNHFEKTLADLQALLRGDEVVFSHHPALGVTAASDTLPLADRPAAARLHWLPADLPKVPLDVAATGPKVIAMAAAVAERVTFSVGAIPERVRWAREHAEQTRADTAVPGNCSYGVQLLVVCHPRVEQVLDAAASMVAPLARFQVLQGTSFGPQSDGDRSNFSALLSYDMNKHGKAIDKDKLKDAKLTANFVRRFAVVGPPDHCVERLLELAELGIERFVVVGPGHHPEADDSEPGLFVSEVMPALRSAAQSLP